MKAHPPQTVSSNLFPNASSSAPLVLRSVAALRAQVAQWRAEGSPIALVPTMGALHDGHLSLVQAGRAWNQEAGPARTPTRCVVSIFVNPTQFGPAEDLSRYPRDEAGDLAKLAGIGADAAFLPSVAEMYPYGMEGGTVVTVNGGGTTGSHALTPHSLTGVLDGPLRPGHFAGVATVVTKLLLQCLPDVALFGEKDYQQLQVVRRMTADLMIPTHIQGVATLRDPDGLAMSSRNRYLTPAERRTAATLPRVLMALAAKLAGDSAGSLDAPATAALLASARAELEDAGIAPVQYLALADAETLEPLTHFEPTDGRSARLLVAAYLGKTRLIDNVAVG